MWWEKTASVFIVRGKRVPYYCVLMQLLQQQQQQHKRKTLVSFKVLDLVPLNPVVHFWDHLAKFSKSTSKTVIASALLCATHSLPNKSLALQNLTSTPDSSARDTHMLRPRSKSILLSLPNKTQFQTNAQWKIQNNPNCIHACVVQSVRHRFENESDFDKLGLNEAACTCHVDWMLYFFGNGLFSTVIKVRYMY